MPRRPAPTRNAYAWQTRRPAPRSRCTARLAEGSTKAMPPRCVPNRVERCRHGRATATGRIFVLRACSCCKAAAPPACTECICTRCRCEHCVTCIPASHYTDTLFPVSWRPTRLQAQLIDGHVCHSVQRVRATVLRWAEYTARTCRVGWESMTWGITPALRLHIRCQGSRGREQCARAVGCDGRNTAPGQLCGVAPRCHRPRQPALRWHGTRPPAKLPGKATRS
jgi:hypothetical protein